MEKRDGLGGLGKERLREEIEEKSRDERRESFHSPVVHGLFLGLGGSACLCWYCMNEMIVRSSSRRG